MLYDTGAPASAPTGPTGICTGGMTVATGPSPPVGFERRVPIVANSGTLDRFLATATATGTSQLRVIRGAQLLADHDGDGAPLHTASVTKLVVASIVGRAVQTTGLRIDTAVATWLPAWAGDDRSAITVRQILGHTSGLSTGDWAAIDAAPPPNLLAAALGLPLVRPPGTGWAYNNLAVMVLPAVVAAVTGQSFFDYAGDQFFAPLGIHRWEWETDDSGHPLAMATLRLNAAALARIGRLLLDDGRLGGDRFLPLGWVEQCTRPVLAGTPSCGLGLFWRWRDDDRSGPPCCLGHDGSGGQHLWCYPETDIVIARLRDNVGSDGSIQPSTLEQEFVLLPRLGASL